MSKLPTLAVEPLTAEAFAPFGEVIEAGPAAVQRLINFGHTMRFHDLADIDVMEGGGKVGVSIFRTEPVEGEVEIKVMEYHPKSSQAFIPLSAHPYLVVVAPAGAFDAGKLQAFAASPNQGVNYRKGTWHHFNLALAGVSDFLVIDRIKDDDNCVELELEPEDRVILKL